MPSLDGQSDSKVEVHKYYRGSVIAISFLALLLQAFLHKYGRWPELLDLPLLVTFYFGASRRNPVSGLFLGAVIGILQDALSHGRPIGLYGIARRWWATSLPPSAGELTPRNLPAASSSFFSASIFIRPCWLRLSVSC